VDGREVGGLVRGLEEAEVAEVAAARRAEATGDRGAVAWSRTARVCRPDRL